MSSSNAKPASDASRRRRNCYVVLLLAGLGGPSCTTEDVDWQDAGEGPIVRPDGRGAGGSSMMDVGGPPMCPTGPPAAWCGMPVSVATALIADFTAPAGGTPPVFGLYGMPVWGGVYAYPASAIDPCTDAALSPHPILSEMRDNQWRVTGTLGSYSGFGLWYNCTVGGNIYPVCILDLSAFSGIQFSVHGDPGPTGTLVLQMRTADDTPAPTDPNTSSCGSCQGTCAFASKSVAVTGARTTVTVLWTELAGGAPHPFDPRQVTGIEWQFPYAGTGTYPIDVVVDDIELLR
jgi:hypothetical protein